ncbi:MAG: hypothetical protein LAO03_10655 [Acidobacteriia bacterium]|nr:hypothetical protein [Terriglobia bacterium]
MERLQKRLKGWDFVELASLVDAPDEITDLWEELGQERTKLAANLRQFKKEIASREGSEAIYSDHFMIVHVRVCQIRLSSTSVFARIHLVPFHGEREYIWPIPPSWPIACSWRRSWHCDELLWIAGGRRMFFSRDVIDEVTGIRAAFPYTDKFEIHDKHFFSMLKPLQSFTERTASHRLQNVNEILNRIEAHKQIPASLRTALQDVPPCLSFFSDAIKLYDFIDKVKSEAGKTLTDGEAGQLIREANLVRRVWDY